MQFVCDTSDNKTWFRIETEYQADHESTLMKHGVQKHFKRACDCARQTYRSTSTIYCDLNRSSQHTRGIVRLVFRSLAFFAVFRLTVEPPH